MSTTEDSIPVARSKIRYALFRCKAGTSNADQDKVFDSYVPQLLEMGLDASDFTTEWDVHPSELHTIVTGKIAKNLNKDKSLFNGEGQLKG